MNLRPSLVLNTHEQPEYLARVLRATTLQTLPPAEVILADDGSGQATRSLFEEWGRAQSFPCAHAWQEHAGFRRSRILNLAIARSRGKYLVFLDGDTVPHPRFLQDHGEQARPGHFFQGHRCLVGERAARWFGLGAFAADRRRAFWGGQLSGWRHGFRWPVPMVRVRTDLGGIRGCNLGIWRADLLAVNGYNEAFQGWGREDSELAVRLMNRGLSRRDVRGRAACFHLWHPPASRARLGDNDRLLAEAQASRATWCDQGVSQHLGAAANGE